MGVVGSIPGSGRFPKGERYNPLLYSCLENSMEEPGRQQCMGSQRIGHHWAHEHTVLMASHSSTLAWKIPGTEEPGRLQSMGSLGVRHNWATSLSLFTFMHWRRKWQPTPVFLPGESQDGGAWWAAVSGVAQSRTRLKRLSSSSSKL